MATYLKFHELERSPFEGEGSDQLVLATSSLRRAYAEVKAGLHEGSPRICISGGPGIGKSSLSRALPKLLDSEARCVLIREGATGWQRIADTMVKQLRLQGGQVSRSSLLAARGDGRRVVLVIDGAEAVTTETLEQLDTLLGYRSDDDEQLVQCVLLANLEEAPRGREVPLLWWLDQLTTRQLRFSPIPEDGIRSYVDKRLKKAGYAGPSIFTDGAITAIYRYTGGVPGAVSRLCEDLLSRAARERKREIDTSLVVAECDDQQEEPQLDFDALPRRREGVSAPPPRVTAPHDDDFPGGAEPELEIQQGLVHMDEEPITSTRGSLELADEGRFGAAARDLDFRPRKELPRSVARLPVRGRGSPRLVRNLIGLAVLACLAMVVHLLFFPHQPTMPRLTKPIPPPAALLGGEPDASAEADAETDGDADDAFAEAGGGDAIAGEDETGLTSDLRLDRSKTNATALAESTGAPEPGAPPAAAGAADPAEDFEPWAEQAPETEPGSPQPAAPAPHP